MKNKKLIIIIAVIVAAFAVCIPLYTNLSASYKAQSIVLGESDKASQIEENAQPGEVENREAEAVKAPDFKVYDENGKEVYLSDSQGKPRIVNFWASWCSSCKKNLPVFEKAYREFGEDVEFIIINLTDGSKDTVSSAKNYINENGYSFPVYFDKDLDAAVKYGVYSIPTTFFIDSSGNAIAYSNGYIDEESLFKVIEVLP